MSEQPFERLAYQNRFVKELRQEIEGVDCFTPFASLNADENLIVLKLSEAQFVRMYSALLTGADITYPDESMQIMVDFLKGIHCPPELSPEECYNLPTYANNIGYSPANPYIEPNTVPDGYLVQPFLVNGQNGNDFPGYEPFDVIVPFDAITFDLDFFEEIAGQLPTLEIMVQGAGSVNIRLLTTVQGGLVVITLDNPPNLLDILSGIVTGAENIVDVNQDLVSLPPETAKEIIFPVNIETAGIHTIYVVFLPILDDSLIPIRFGGGFRGLELCGFLPEGEMGLQNLRFLDCNLEQQNADGSWSVVDGWEDWLDCVPSGGGGGGAVALSPFINVWDLGGNVTNNTQTFATAISTVFTPTKANFIAMVKNVTLQNSAGAGVAEIRLRWNGLAGEKNSLIQANGTSGRETGIDDWWENVEVGIQQTLAIEFRSQTASNTVTVGAGLDQILTIIEWDNPEDLYIQDIRFNASTRELEKQIAGAWITVTDSLAATLNSIQAIANNAAAAAAAAQSTANNALTVANGAVTVNNSQNAQLNSLDSRLDSIETVDIPQINLTLANHESRIAALEAALAGSSNWGGYKLGQITDLDLSPTAGRYSSPFSTFDSSAAHRWWTPTANNDIDVFSANAMRLGAAAFVRVSINVENYVAGTFSARINGGQEALLLQNIGSGNNWGAWIPVMPNESADMQIEVSASTGGNTWGLRQVAYLLLNFNPFTLQALP